MSRQSIAGQIYGYGVSLLAVLIIIFSIHGIVNNTFRVINPAASGMGMHAMMMHHGSMGGPGMGMPGMPNTSPVPGGAMQPNPSMGMNGPMAMHAQMEGLGRFNAIRLLVISIVMLIVGIKLFRWHWDWLHKTA